jgi:hypothetical protein
VRLEAARAALGTAELVAPSVIGWLLLWRKPARGERIVAGVLGGRHVMQAAFTHNSGPRLHVIGADVDLLHCASMLLCGAFDRRHRRAALTSAAIAFLFAVCEYRLSSRAD